MKKQGGKRKVHPTEHRGPQNTGRDRRPSSVNNAKKKRKTTEGERLEISSRKLDISKKYFIQKWAQQRTEMVKT